MVDVVSPLRFIRNVIVMLVASLLMSASPVFATPTTAMLPTNWAVYYSLALPAEAFASYDIVVFDSDHSPDIQPLKAQGKTVLGYLSLGEAETYRDYFTQIKQQKLLLAPNTAWKGHLMIDIRNPAWKDMVLTTLIPQILHKGFNGIMLDTIDSAIELEKTSPKHYAGMKQAAIELIRDIRTTYPHIKIMLNRGLPILPDVAGAIDMLLAESIYASHAKKSAPRLFPASVYDECVTLIHSAQQINPALVVMTLDYWDMSDIKGVKNIYSTQRAQGFIPYVSTMVLNEIFEEPL